MPPAGDRARRGTFAVLSLELPQERGQIGLLFLRQLQFQDHIKELNGVLEGSGNGRRADTAGYL